MEKPAWGCALPAGHDTQLDSPLTGEAGPYDPLSQAVQATLPVDAAYCPLSHGEHAARPDTLAIVPAGQAVQAVEASTGE